MNDNFEFSILNFELELQNFEFIKIESNMKNIGGVAQLGERLPCTQEVIGSSPFTSTS